MVLLLKVRCNILICLCHHHTYQGNMSQQSRLHHPSPCPTFSYMYDTCVWQCFLTPQTAPRLLHCMMVDDRISASLQLLIIWLPTPLLHIRPLSHNMPAHCVACGTHVCVRARPRRCCSQPSSVCSLGLRPTWSGAHCEQSDARHGRAEGACAMRPPGHSTHTPHATTLSRPT